MSQRFVYDIGGMFSRQLTRLEMSLVRRPFLDLVKEQVVVLDGAMGSALQEIPLDLERDWLGLENCSEILVQTRPDVIGSIHESFLEAGCDAVETNTFGANKIVLAEFGIPEKTFELNKLAAEVARKACDKYETPDRPRYVIGSIGPGTKLPTLQHTTWDILHDSYAEQIRGLLAGGVDALLIETCQDLLQVKCAVIAATDVMKAAGIKLPIMTQMSMDLNSGQSMLLGSDSAAVTAALLPFDQIDVIGLNCATGPVELTEHVKYFCEHWPRYVSVLPNAGMPVMVDGQSHFPLTPDDFARGVMRFVEEFGVNIVGGCCGTRPAHLKRLCEMLGKRAPKARQPSVKRQISSLTQVEDFQQDNSYLIVAERTNTNGSRQFKRLLQEEDFDGLVSMARDEVRSGSHMLDVCVDFVGRDGKRDMHEVVGRYVRQIALPLMIDSTDAVVMEEALKLAGGRCVLNSMNLEDGPERVVLICKLARRYGAAVVAGTIDEDKENAMARTAARKLSIALRLRKLANEQGLHDSDILFDPLVLPISTGIEADRRNALETIEGIRDIKRELPECYTVVGLSNVSFGLKPAARQVLNSVFLHECMEAGLTGAIVHASKILPRNKIDDLRWNAALDLIYDRRGTAALSIQNPPDDYDPLTRFISLFTDVDAIANEAAPQENLTIEEKLKRHIVDGEKRNLIEDLTEAMLTYKPLQIINDLLLAGMKTVGELFGSGQMQLPFVLQSAETMKAAVAHLEPFMEKIEGSGKGRIVLATVKGDVHDIGKNLVDIILTNNGYTVYNLGIKQPINDILKALKDKKADAVGMSGLLVKSVAVMKENLAEMNQLGIDVPVLLGGAALTRDYAEDDLANLYKGPLLYCRDAFDGLKVMDHIAGGTVTTITDEQRERAAHRKNLRANAVKPSNAEAANIQPILKDNPVPIPPFWGRRVVKDISPYTFQGFINETALFTGQWGFKRKGMSEADYERLLDEKARTVFDDLKTRARTEKFLLPAVVYGYYPVQSRGDELIVYHTEEFAGCTCHPSGPCKISPTGTARPAVTWKFPRQDGRRKLCISDFFRSVDSGQFDVLAVQLVTVGSRVSELAEELRKENKYQDYLFLHGFGVESAEALAEYWHKHIRQELGFGSDDAPEMRKLFQQGYRGSRYSFGYPACPNLEDRQQIIELLRPQEIGVALTENFMLTPEQSTDAIVVHHPQARYFDV